MPPEPPDVPAPRPPSTPPDRAPDAPAAQAARLFEEAAAEGASQARPQPLPLEEVARLFPDLEIQGLIGVGGMGVVYRARHRRLDRLVALKLLPPPLAREPEFAERFEREARALARLDHPHIVRVHDVGQVEGHGFLVLEHVDGANLRQVMAAGRLTEKEALAIVPQVCEALQYAHDQGVVHRDIKPENVLLDAKGQVKIADFGLAKLTGRPPGATGLTASGQVMGTFEYMAPEQVRTPQDVDHRADLYSLGVVFYEMLTGALPMGRFEPPSEAANLDARIDRIVMHALERERTKRYQQAEEMRTDVTGLATPASAAQGRVAWHAPRTAAAPRQESAAAPQRGHAMLWFATLALGLGWAVYGLVHVAWGSVERGTHDAQSREVWKGLAAAAVFGAGIFTAVRLGIQAAQDPTGSRRHKQGVHLALLNVLSLGALLLVVASEVRTHAMVRGLPRIGAWPARLEEWESSPEREECARALRTILDDLREHGATWEVVARHYRDARVALPADEAEFAARTDLGLGPYLLRMTPEERDQLVVVGALRHALDKRRVTAKLDAGPTRFWWTFEMERAGGAWVLAVGPVSHKVER